MPSSPPSSYRIGTTGVASVTYVNGTAEQIARVEHILYDNLPNGDYRLWTFFMQRHRALVTRNAGGNVTSDATVVEIEFVDQDANPGDGAHTYAFTTWKGQDFPLHIKLWESEARMQNDLFFRETVAHEFGHVATFLLMEALGESHIKETLCGYYGLPVSRWDDPSLPWERRVIEATAEFFKDVMVPREFRQNDNRTEYRFPAGPYEGWLDLFVRKLYNMNAGSEDGPFFVIRLVPVLDVTLPFAFGTLFVEYRNDNKGNPALTPLRFPMPALEFEAVIPGDFLGDGLNPGRFEWTVAGNYVDLDDFTYDTFGAHGGGFGDVSDPSIAFTIPPPARPGSLNMAIGVDYFGGAIFQTWSEAIWAKLADHGRYNAWDPGGGILLPDLDDTHGRPPYPTYFPPYPYTEANMSVGHGPFGTIRHRRAVTGQEYGKPLGQPPAPTPATGRVSTRATRGLAGTVRR